MVSSILITLFLVFLNGFFVAAEFAIVKVRASQIQTGDDHDEKTSKTAQHIVSHLDSYLAATQLGITLASLGLGWVGEGVVSKIIKNIFDYFNWGISDQLSHDIALPLAFLTITILHIVFGELAPKSVAIRYPTKTTYTVALPLQIFYFIFRPFIWLLNGFANFFLKIIGIKPIQSAETHTEAELKVIIQESANSGAIRHIEQDIVERVFVLGDRKASELMTHRSDVIWFDIKDSLQIIKEKIRGETHSVYPVCDGNQDHLIGVLPIWDLFISDINESSFELKDHIREALVLTENTPAYKLLEQFNKAKFHYGIVTDEFGIMQGVLSMDDVMDALLGQMTEYNEEEFKISKQGENSWIADAGVPFFLFLEYFDLEEDENETKGFNTLAGFILDQLEHLPEVGEKVLWKGFELEVLALDRRRITKVSINRSK